ncbi:hypothetical protein C5S29_05785 [ANME-1 cluster archaeon GoMg3.2]|nr:hypothetical protein [ANME-1 cluster archaeon GoMg3.2]
MKSNKKIVLLGIFVLAFLVMGVVPVCGLSDSGANSPICGLTDSGSPEVSPNFTFYAVYDRLVDLNSFDFTHAAMSGDGNKLIYSGRDETSNKYTVYTVNTDGTGLTQIALPDLEGAGIGELAIDHDGSRAFFKAGRVFCKVENGVATKIFDRDDYPDIGGILSQIQTTADGGYVYFLNDEPNNNDVWRVAHSGGSPELVIDDVLVQRDGGVGKQVAEFTISDDGNTIAFTLHGYAGESGYRSKCELFVRDATGGYRQLTNDEDNVEKSNLAISGDGAIIVFRYALWGKTTWDAIKSDGSTRIFLEDAGYNTGGPVLNYDGTKMFYSDHKGGRLVNTDGSGSIGLFPSWDVGAITIAARTDLCINDDGHQISFISYGSISIMPSDHVVYMGYLNDPNAVPDAPVIESIAFDPPAMPRGDPDAVIVLTSEISDPQGLADIKRTSMDELVNGRLYGGTTNVPVYFGHAANDVGWSHDQTAGDGIFSTAGKPGGKIDELDQMTVRMGVEDASGTVVVADTVLFIGEVPPTPTPTPTGTSTKPEILSHSSYISGLGFFEVVGEVKNNLPDNIKYVKITATFYDAEKNVVGTDFTYTQLNILKPNQKSPFDLSTYPDKIRPASYKLKVSYKVSNEEPFAGLVILSHSDRIDSMGYHKIVGEVKNNGVSASSYVKLVSTYYDAKGEVIGTDFTYTDPSDIDAGDSAPFELSSYPRKLRPSRYELQVEGR